jgi:hypothetical protein
MEMERVASEAGVAPTRISFTGVVACIRDELSRMGDARFAPGTIPSRLEHLRRNLKRILLPEHRPLRVYPRAVKVNEPLPAEPIQEGREKETVHELRHWP